MSPFEKFKSEYHWSVGMEVTQRYAEALAFGMVPHNDRTIAEAAMIYFAKKGRLSTDDLTNAIKNGVKQGAHLADERVWFITKNRLY